MSISSLSVGHVLVDDSADEREVVWIAEGILGEEALSMSSQGLSVRDRGRVGDRRFRAMGRGLFALSEVPLGNKALRQCKYGRIAACGFGSRLELRNELPNRERPLLGED